MAEATYPLAMPTSPNFTRSEWGISRAVSTSQSPFTFSTQAFKFAGAKWYSTVTLPPMKREQGTIANTVAVNANFSVGAYDVTIDGADASESQLFKKGDYVQFNSGASSKMHMIIADVASNGSGIATLAIEPPLSAVLGNNATVTYASPKCVMRMTSNELTWSADRISLYGVSFSCEEVL